MPNAVQVIFLVLACAFLGFAVFKFAKALKNLIVAKRNKKKALEDNTSQEVNN